MISEISKHIVDVILGVFKTYGVSNDRLTTGLRQFSACIESTKALIVLVIQAYKTAAKFGKETVFELLYVLNTPYGSK